MNDEMSPREFDDYVGLLARLLRLRASQRDAIAEELRAHLEERFAALTEQGVGPREAISMALAEFGDAAALAAQFSSVAKLQKRRWMMRIGVTSAMTLLVALGVVVARWPDGTGQWAGAAAQAQQTGEKAKQRPATQSAELIANAATMAKLEQIGAAQFQENTLGEALDYFAGLGKFQVHIDRRALEEEGVKIDAPITLQLRDVPIEMLLRMTLKPLNLTYMLNHGVVIITSPAEEDANPEVRVYRVDDLVRPAETPVIPGPAAVPAGRDARYDTAAGVRLVQMSGSTPPVRKPSNNPDMEALINLITRVVEPQSWESAGGPGVIVEYRGVLVITQPTRIQMKIEKFLGELRETIRPQEQPRSI